MSDIKIVYLLMQYYRWGQ